MYLVPDMTPKQREEEKKVEEERKKVAEEKTARVQAEGKQGKWIEGEGERYGKRKRTD